MWTSIQNEEENIPATNSGALPTTKQIQNILYYNRRKYTSNNVIVNFQNFIDDADGVITSHRESKISGMDFQFANNK